METEFVEVAFWPDEEMYKCATEMFSELQDIEYFNLS
jgi:hypothetical protein